MNRLVAHRGDMTTYPENSVLALRNAVLQGYQHLELDIQLSKDLVPIVIHDENLKRTTGVDKNVWDFTAKELEEIPLIFPEHLKEEIDHLFVPTLLAVIKSINEYSRVNLFFELKKESIERFGLETVIDHVLEVQKNAKFNVIIISFLTEVIEYVKSKENIPTGYVLKKYNKKYYSNAEKIKPDYLFCNIKKINEPAKLWKGPWKWVLYDIKNPSFAYELLKQGVDMIETGDIAKLSKSEYFANG